MRRFSGLLVLLLCSLPFSVSVVGCKHAVAPDYCPGFSDSGPVAGQISKITFGGNLTTTGESLNFGQIGSGLSASATDCFGTSVSVSAFTYGTSDRTIADINPTTGQVCAGTWNRNTGGGVPDYSVCTPPAATPLGSVAYVTASSGGATSNPIPIYVHPVVTSVSIGSATPTASCSATTAVTGTTTSGSNVVTGVSSTAGIAVGQGLSGAGIPSGTTITSIVPGATANTGTLTLLYNATTTATAAALTVTVADPSSNCCPANTSLITGVATYNQQSCVSQNFTAQLVGKVYQGGYTDAVHNITCQVGHVTFSPQSSSSVVTIDANGIATADQPGSTTVLATVASSGSGSTAGFFSTCPPASISLTATGSTAPLSVALNNAQALSTTVLDTAGNPITGLPLEFVSTSPQTLSTGSNTVTPSFPGTGTITAICQPGSCNPSPYSQIGYLANGKPITSNGLTVTTSGTSSNQVVVASTDSLFFYSVDFTTGSTGALYKLPFLPNSMVLTQDGSTLYFGSTNVLMSASTLNGAVSSIGAIAGTVLAVSPDGATLVIADPTRNLTSLYSSGGGLESTTNGVGTRAQWSPDSSTVYIAAGTQMLVHSTFTGWTSTPVAVNYQDVAVTVPAYGAYFAAGTETDARSYCATSVGTTPANPPPAVSNTFYPLAETETVPTQRVAATADGAHLLGGGFATAGANVGPNLYDFVLTAPTSSTDARLACTRSTAAVTFSSTPSTKPLPIPATSSFTGVVPASNSTLAFVTYSVPATVTTAGLLPYYIPSTGVLSSITLSGGATAPLAGAFSTDNKTFYTSTSGDKSLHIVTVNGTSVTDSSTIPLNLPSNSITNGIAAPNLLVQRVKKATS